MSKTHKLLKTYEFRRVYQAKRHYRTDGLSFAYLTSCHLPGPKLGITIKKKWGKAHERNRFKRIVREAYRQLLPSFPKNLQLIVHPREGFDSLTSDRVKEEMSQWLMQDLSSS